MSAPRLVAAFALALGGFAAGALGPGAPPATAGARARFDAALRSTKDASASFTQRQEGPLGAVESRGSFEYLRPRRVRMRWTGRAAATAYVVEDTLWFDQPAQGAVLRASAHAGGAPGALFVGGSLAEVERACRVEERGPLALALTPKQADAGWERLDLALDAATGWPRTVVLRGKDGTTTRLQFGTFRLNRGLAPARFVPRFAPGRVVTPWGG